jgi:hypothetical protein
VWRHVVLAFGCEKTVAMYGARDPWQIEMSDGKCYRS